MDRHLENCILRAANNGESKKEIERLLKDIQQFWDDDVGDIDAVYLLEDIERVLRRLV